MNAYFKDGPLARQLLPYAIKVEVIETIVQDTTPIGAHGGYHQQLRTVRYRRVGTETVTVFELDKSNTDKD